GSNQTARRLSATGQPYWGFNVLVGRATKQPDITEVWPLLRNCDVTEITQNSAHIAIDAAYEGTYISRYATTLGSYPNRVTMTLQDTFEATGIYEATLTGLSPDRTYYFTIMLEETPGVAGRTGVYTFSTANGSS